MTVFAVQVIPYSFLKCDMECAELIDYEESESEEKDKEDEKTRSFESSIAVVGVQGQGLLSSFHFLNGFPIPPYLETLSPPPDLI